MSKVNYDVEPQPLCFHYKFTTPIRDKPVRKEELKARKQNPKHNVKQNHLCFFFVSSAFHILLYSVLKPESTMQYL